MRARSGRFAAHDEPAARPAVQQQEDYFPRGAQHNDQTESDRLNIGRRLEPVKREPKPMSKKQIEFSRRNKRAERAPQSGKWPQPEADADCADLCINGPAADANPTAATPSASARTRRQDPPERREERDSPGTRDERRLHRRDGKRGKPTTTPNRGTPRRSPPRAARRPRWTAPSWRPYPLRSCGKARTRICGQTGPEARNLLHGLQAAPLADLSGEKLCRPIALPADGCSPIAQPPARAPRNNSKSMAPPSECPTKTTAPSCERWCLPRRRRPRHREDNKHKDGSLAWPMRHTCVSSACASEVARAKTHNKCVPPSRKTPNRACNISKEAADAEDAGRAREESN